MLKKKYRIRKEKEFQKIFHLNKKIYSQNFQILFHFIDSRKLQTQQNPNGHSPLAHFCTSEDKEGIKKDNSLNLISDSYPKFGFIVSKKIGNAVVRNKVKRRLREIIRLEIPRLKANFEAIVIAYPQITMRSFQELREEVLCDLERNHLLKIPNKKTQIPNLKL